MMSTQGRIRFWTGLSLAMQIALLVSVLWLGYLAFSTNATLCDFKRDLQSRTDASREFLEAVQTGRRALPAGFTIQDLQVSLSAREATLRSLSDLTCS